MKGMASYDILVVGAGPAGASTALAAAKRGRRVLVVDRRHAVGVPVQCAEYIPAMLLGHLDLEKSFIVQRIEGMKTYVPGEPVEETRAPGYTIHRDLFDQAMVRAASNAGADLMLSTKAVRRIDDEIVHLKRREGHSFLARAKIIVGADGPRSTVGSWVGAANGNFLLGLQATLRLNAPMAWTEIYFDPKIYAGYGWLFPKEEVANVGIGLKRISRKHERIRSILDRFISRLRAEGKVAGASLRQAAGWIPAEPVRQAVYGNVALVGDAAGHTHSITGAGIASAVVCGEMAGTWAALAVEKDDVRVLKQYDHQWQDLLKEPLDRAYRRRQTLERDWPDFSRTIRQCWIAFRHYYA